MATNINAAKRYKDIDLPFTCPISGRDFNSTSGLSIYVTKTLKMDHKEYYDSYVNHRDKSCYFCGSEGYFMSIGKGYRNLCQSDECLKKSFKSNSIEGIMYKEQCSRENAIIIFEKNNNGNLEKRTKSFNESLKKNPNFNKERSRNCKEFWIKRGYSEEESMKKSMEVMKNIHIKTSEKKKENKELYKDTYTTNIEYWIKRGYSEEDAKILLSKRQTTFSKEICIEKFGEELGLEKWKKRQEDWIKTLDSKSDYEKIEINRKKLFNNSGYSKISQDLFWKIYDNFKDNNIHFEELNGEIIRYDKKRKKHYRYDYIDFSLKKCIEFNGDYWHCNPIKYDENFIHPIVKISAKDIWEKDIAKNNWIENRGYQVLTIWESEYRKNHDETLKKCLDFLNN